MRLARWLIVPLVAIPLGWILFTGLGRDPAEIPSPLIGQPIPAFSLTTLEGDTFSTAELEGAPAIINFWASYCIPACVDEHPVLLDTQATHGDELRLVGVMLSNDTPDGALAFLARYGDGGWPQADDQTGEVALDYGVIGPPETFFVDAEGIVRAKHYGPLTDEDMTGYLGLIGVTQ